MSDSSFEFLNGNRNLYFQLFTSLPTAFKTWLHRLFDNNEAGEVSSNSPFFALCERAEEIQANSDSSLPDWNMET